MSVKILGIETSCDETAAAVVADGMQIVSNIVASQVDIHARYGGIIPEIASRQHLLSIIPVIQSALSTAGISWTDLDGIAVTRGPGLSGSLLVGVNAAKAVALAQNLPLLGINHLEAHIYANWLDGNGWLPELPALCLIISGGHSDLILMPEHGRHIHLGRTRDDAAGEAFDKTARILQLGYPGGPAIEKAAQEGNPGLFPLPRAWLRGSDDFSFSGLKTAALHTVENNNLSSVPENNREFSANIAASFQKSVIDVLVTKTIRAAQREGVKQILLSGGVAANKTIRQVILERSPLPVHFPPLALCTDNAAMVASCGYFHFCKGERSNWDMDVIPTLSWN